MRWDNADLEKGNSEVGTDLRTGRVTVKIPKVRVKTGESVIFQSALDPQFALRKEVGMLSFLLRLQILLLLVLGVYLRTSQFRMQVLLDDEWHAVHQLLSGKTPEELFLTLGLADYSVPLGILYYWISHSSGLTEFSMRLPMLLASAICLVTFSAYVWRRFPPTTTLLFTLFLAISPLLTIYAHTARPYAVTLLLSYAALYFFYQYGHSPKDRWIAVLGYAACAGLCLWLHLITGPFLIAPFVLEAVRALRQRNWSALPALAHLGFPATTLMLCLVLPPLITDHQSLTGKSGLADIGWDTALGVWYIWLGSGSTLIVLGLVCLALLGLPVTLRQDRLVQAALLGVVLTLALVLASQPAWVQHPLTMGRYLLSFIPILILAIASGITVLVNGTSTLRLAALAGVGVLLIAYTASSPSWPLAIMPNSQMTHSLYQFDFRVGHNKVDAYQQQHLGASPFWAQLASEPSDSLRIAVAPFYFETYNWGAPRWERDSNQRVFPAYLTGYCVPNRFGEVPRNSLYRFSNAYYLDQIDDTGIPRPDWVVYTRHFSGFSNGLEDQSVGEDTKHCLKKMRKQLGKPDYEDDVLLAWSLGDN